MEVHIVKKKLGSRKELGRHPIEIDDTVNTLEALLYTLTRQGLTEAQTPKENHALSDSEIAEQAEITTWDAPIKLCQGAEIVIIRLTMLTGLYF